MDIRKKREAMVNPTNIKTLLFDEMVEWAGIRFKETWNVVAFLKFICVSANDLNNWGL